MKLSALLSYHYVVYVALALLLSVNKVNRPCISAPVAKIEEVKHSPLTAKDAGKVLHSELLYRY